MRRKVIRYRDGVPYIRDGTNLLSNGKRSAKWAKAERCKCPICEKPFLTRNGRTTYCGYSCAAKARQKGRIRRLKTKKCVICKKFFQVPLGHESSYKTCRRPYCKHRLRSLITKRTIRADNDFGRVKLR